MEQELTTVQVVRSIPVRVWIRCGGINVGNQLEQVLDGAWHADSMTMNYSPDLNHDVGIFTLLEARVPDRSTDVHCVNGTRVLLHTVGRRPGTGDIKQAIEPDSKSAIERSRGMLRRDAHTIPPRLELGISA
jgi:hypothetical protein